MNDKSHYYMSRINQGHAAVNRGGPNTPLVTALKRWGNYAPILKVGEYEIPRAWDSYLNGLREIIDAVDEEDRQAPFRFLLVGEHWEIQYTKDGVYERGVFHDCRGLQHYARLLREPEREIPSLVLDGKPTGRSTAQAEIGVTNRFSRQEEMGPDEVRTLAAEVEKLNREMEAAKRFGDLDRADRLFQEKQKLWEYLHADEGDSLETISHQRKRFIGPETEGRKIHKTVARAMGRAIVVLRDGKMPALVRFLERSVDSTGGGFVYRPDTPAPAWVL